MQQQQLYEEARIRKKVLLCPYTFFILHSEGCSLNVPYLITCSRTNQTPILFLENNHSSVCARYLTQWQVAHFIASN